MSSAPAVVDEMECFASFRIVAQDILELEFALVEHVTRSSEEILVPHMTLHAPLNLIPTASCACG